MVFNVKRKSRGIDPKTGKKKKDRTYTGYFQYPWMKKISLFTRICGRNPVPGVRQAGDISTLLQF